MTEIQKICVDCGKEFTAHSHKALRCSDCRYTHHLEMVRKNNRKNQKVRTEQKKVCLDCGKEFTARSALQVRCTECQAVYKKAHAKEYAKERYWKERSAIIAEREAMGLPTRKKTGPKTGKKPAEKKKGDPNICKRTETCYYGGITGCLPICDFLAITGSRRPCPVKGCCLYKRKGRRNERNKHGTLQG